MRIGLALNCRIQACSFHRKNYFYPDMPKAYQISQYDVPLNVDGWLDLPDGTRIGIERAHLEEDTGKSTHVGGAGGRIHGSDASLIDFNRAGVPLVEIVGRPDIRTAEQARQYVTELRAILVAVGASDAKMEEGSMRVDANVSVHKPGEPFGTRCEIKNLNSVRSLGRAIEYEARRQIDLLEAGEAVRQETRHWDEGDGRTHTLRSKEDADDYRYFLEPDLVPLVPDDDVDRARSAPTLPPLPAARRAAPGRGHRRGRRRRGRRRRRRAGPGRLRARRRRGRRRRRPGRSSTSRRPTPSRAPEPAVPAADLAALTTLETAGALTATQAKQVLAELVAAGGGDAGGDRRGQGLRGDGRRRRSRRSSTRPSPPTPAAWAKYRGRRGQGDRRPRRRRDEGVAGPGRRRRRHRAPAQPARLSRHSATPAARRRARPARPGRSGSSAEVSPSSPRRQRCTASGRRRRRCAQSGRARPRRGRTRGDRRRERHRCRRAATVARTSVDVDDAERP